MPSRNAISRRTIGNEKATRRVGGRKATSDYNARAVQQMTADGLMAGAPCYASFPRKSTLISDMRARKIKLEGNYKIICTSWIGIFYCEKLRNFSMENKSRPRFAWGQRKQCNCATANGVKHNNLDSCLIVGWQTEFWNAARKVAIRHQLNPSYGCRYKTCAGLKIFSHCNIVHKLCLARVGRWIGIREM